MVIDAQSEVSVLRTSVLSPLCPTASADHHFFFSQEKVNLTVNRIFSGFVRALVVALIELTLFDPFEAVICEEQWLRMSAFRTFTSNIILLNGIDSRPSICKILRLSAMTGNSRWFIGYPGITMSSSWIRIDHHIDHHIDHNQIIISSHHHNIIISSSYHYHITMIGSSCHRIILWHPAPAPVELDRGPSRSAPCTSQRNSRGRLGRGSNLAFSQPKQGSKHRFLGWVD